MDLSFLETIARMDIVNAHSELDAGISGGEREPSLALQTEELFIFMRKGAEVLGEDRHVMGPHEILDKLTKLDELETEAVQAYMYRDTEMQATRTFLERRLLFCAALAADAADGFLKQADALAAEANDLRRLLLQGKIYS